MNYKRLFIEKDEKESQMRDYSIVRSFLSSTKEIFEIIGKHKVTTTTKLEDITDQLYENQDCVIAHPSIPKLLRLKELHEKYPKVCLIIRPPFLINETNRYKELIKDIDNVYISDETGSKLLKHVNEIVKEIQDTHTPEIKA